MGRFDDRATRPIRGLGDMLRWKILRRGVADARKRPGDPAFKMPVREPDLALLASARASLTWIGHATFAMRLGGKLILTDPVWGRAGGLVARQVAPGVAFEALPAADIVLVSHNHMDHMCLPTLRKIGPEALYVVPLGNADLLRKEGLLHVIELDWWETHRLGNLEVTLVPSRHWSMRMPWTRNDMLWGGFVIRGPEGVAYHSGDTAFFDDFAEIGRRAGPIDWAMLPIGAYEPRWFMEPQHMNVDEAVRAYELLGAKTMVAMHWGTFILTDEPIDEPPARLRELCTQRSYGPDKVWLLDIGESRPLR